MSPTPAPTPAPAVSLTEEQRAFLGEVYKALITWFSQTGHGWIVEMAGKLEAAFLAPQPAARPEDGGEWPSDEACDDLVREILRHVQGFELGGNRVRIEVFKFDEVNTRELIRGGLRMRQIRRSDALRERVKAVAVRLEEKGNWACEKTRIVQDGSYWQGIEEGLRVAVSQLRAALAPQDGKGGEGE